MKRLAFTYRTHIDFEVPVTEHYFTLRCLPKDTPCQRVLRRELQLEPELRWSLQEDGFGNLLQTGCCREGHIRFGYVVSGEAEVDRSVPDRSPCNPAFLYPSPLTVPGPALLSLHEKAKGSGPEELMRLVHERIRYTPGSTGVNTTAEQALAQGRGVCQDEAHILAALLRLEGFPARYVSGLFVGEGATHAWTEVWQDGCWRGLDPTRCRTVGEEYLTLSTGRDYADCPVERGVFRGNTAQTQTVFMQVTELPL